MEITRNTAQIRSLPPKAQPKAPDNEPRERFESGSSERFSKLKVLVRPALAAASGVAIGAGVTALAAGGAATALTIAAPAILLGAAAGIAIGVVGMPKEHGYLAGLGKVLSGGMNGLFGAAGGLVGKAGALGLLAGGLSGSALAAAGAAVVGVVGVGWALSKVADTLSYR